LCISIAPAVDILEIIDTIQYLAHFSLISAYLMYLLCNLREIYDLMLIMKYCLTYIYNKNNQNFCIIRNAKQCSLLFYLYRNVHLETSSFQYNIKHNGSSIDYWSKPTAIVRLYFKEYSFYNKRQSERIKTK
jgi:hypothetical protein